jgi:hypothetical protein
MACSSQVFSSWKVSNSFVLKSSTLSMAVGEIDLPAESQVDWRKTFLLPSSSLETNPLASRLGCGVQIRVSGFHLQRRLEWRRE